MQAYEIITYGGGDVLNGVFEAIGRMRGVGHGSVISGLIIVAVLCGYIKSMVTNAVDGEVRSSIKWAISVIIFLSFMYIPTVNVVICDKTINQSKPIANIPLGVALLASIPSQIGHLLAQEFEDQFSIPQESHRRYTKYGTLFSSSLINAASQFEIVTPRVERNFRNFARQCVLYDVRIGAHYTLDDLVYAQNGWKLIKSKTSTLRMFDYHDGASNQVVTCKDGAQYLDQDLTKEAERHTKVFNWRFFGKSGQATNNDEFSIKKSQMAQNYLTTQIPSSHTFLTQMAGNATEILKQHMVRNAIKDSVIKNAQIVGANAAAQGFAIARAQEHQRNTFQIIGSFAAKNLPELSIFMQAMLYGSFMVIFLLVVQPGGFAILKRFAGIVVWIQAWPPLFAIVNYIQTEKLRSATLAAATFVDPNGAVATGWNLFTSPAIVQANLDVASYAGFYSMLVPVIAISLVQGVSSFLTLATHLGGLTQSSASHAAEEATTGNYNFGNVSADNYSGNNTSANHYNTAASFAARRSDWELSSGSTLSSMGDGSVALNQMSGGSQLMTSVRLNDLYSASVQKQSQEAQTALYNDGVAYSSSIVDATAKAINLAKSAGTNQSEGTHYQHGEHASVADALSKQQAVSNKLMDEYGVNEEQSIQLIAAANLGLQGKLDLNKMPVNLVSTFLSKFGGISGSIQAGGNVDAKALSVATAQEAVKRAQDLIISENATQSLDTIVKAAQDGHFNVGTDKQGRITEDFRTSLDEMHRQENNYNASLQKLDGLQKMSSFLQSSNLNIDQNLQQYTFEQIANLKDEAGNKFGEAKADQILKDPLIAKSYIDRIVANDVNHLVEQYKDNAFTSEQIAVNYQTKTTNNEIQLKNNYENNKQNIIKDGNSIGINTYDNTVISNTNQDLASKLLEQNKDTIKNQNTETDSSNDQFKKSINQKLDLHDRGLIRRASANTWKRFFNMDDKK